MKTEAELIKHDELEDERLTNALENFYVVMRRRMNHGFITGQFLREELFKVDPEWESVHGENGMRVEWGDPCKERHNPKECPGCMAWRMFETKMALGEREAEPTQNEVIEAMNKEE